MYVLMITPNNFPQGDAGAVRDEYFAKIYQELGYEVIHIGMNKSHKRGTYRNVYFVSVYKKNKSFIQKVYNNLNYGNQLLKVYDAIEKEKGKPSFIHIYDIPKAGIDFAKKISIQYKIPLVHDSVEWYSPCEFKLGKMAYPYILKNRCNTKLIEKPIAVIAISSFLEKYFIKKGLKTVRIPVIMDCNDYSPKKRLTNSKIKIVYAGSPAKKDYLKECIEAFSLLSLEKQDLFDFDVFGVSQEFVENCCLGNISKQIVAHGRVPRKEVIKKLEDADFSILIRPANERYTKAGFPTKSVEALMNGCAMICNLTSDLDIYLKDQENAMIIEDSSVENIKKVLEKISNLSNEELIELRKNARKTAEEKFDYRLYILKMKNFLSSLNENIADF